jgi:hypothetical protein
MDADGHDPASATALDRLGQYEQAARDIAARDHPLIRDGQVITDNNGNTISDPKIAAHANRIINDIAVAQRAPG